MQQAVSPVPVFLAMLGILAALVTTGCEPTTIESPEIKEQVFDAATGKPLEGVHVVAVWVLRERMIHGTSFRQIADIREAVTGKDGLFVIPAVTIRNPMRYELSSNPNMVLFKPGYQAVSAIRHFENGKSLGIAINGAAGQTYRLVKLPSRYFEPKLDKDYPDSGVPPFAYIQSALDEVIPTCSTRFIPRFAEAASKERARLEALGFKSDARHLPSLEDLEVWGRQCRPGSPTR